MNHRRLIFLLFYLLFIECVRPQRSANKGQVLSDVIIARLQSSHYDPVLLDDRFSKKAFKLYLKRIDFDKRFLLKGDVEKLKVFETKLDDDIDAGTFHFLKKTNEILLGRVKQVQSFYASMVDNMKNLESTSFLELDSDKRKYCANIIAWKQRWRKIIRYQILIEYINKLKISQTKKKLKTLAITNNQVNKKALIKASKKKVKKALKIRFKRILENREDDKISLYINSLLGIFDPHTMYMAPRKKEDFDIQMSGQLEGIGALLREDNGYIKVVRIVPGSAAWRQKELKAEDIILKVAQGSKEPVDIVGVRIGDAVRLIRGKKGSEVRLTVKKPEGAIVVIPIIRDVVVVEETYAKSAIIADKDGNNRIGYIYLPKFYHDFTKSAARNSSGDVRKELEQLKIEGVKGIILDLRNNGGGALDDAVKMSGLFIESGPIVQIRNQYGGGNVLTDPDDKSVYDGHLIVMVNRFSASASEILAAALQDYKRAIIVGSSASFGKGTVQNLVNLSRYARGAAKKYLPLGALKYTMQKFYRINGGSTQYKGVSPNVKLPDNVGYIKAGEKTLDYSMKWDKVKKLKYKIWRKYRYDIASLQKRSKERVKVDERFAFIIKNVKRLKKERDDTLQSLKLTTIIAQQDKLTLESKKFKKLKGKLGHLKVSGVKRGKLTKARKKELKEWYKQLRKDAYIEESLRIMADMIETAK